MFKYDSIIKAIVIIERVSIFVVIILTIILTSIWLISNLLS